MILYRRVGRSPVLWGMRQLMSFDVSRSGLTFLLLFCWLPWISWTGTSYLMVKLVNCWIDLFHHYRFLSRIRARPRHLSVIAISALHLAACQWVERHRSSPMVGCNGENTQGKPQVALTILKVLYMSSDSQLLKRCRNPKIWWWYLSASVQPVTLCVWRRLLKLN